MARNIDLGDDFNMAFGRIRNDVAQVILCIESANARGRLVVGDAHGGGARQLGQARVVDGVALFAPIVGDLDAPALVIGKMQVKLVELVHGHDIDGLLDLVYGQEGSGRVEHDAAVFEARCVLDVERRDGPRAIGEELRGTPGAKQLVKRLLGVEEAVCGRGCDLDALV